MERQKCHLAFPHLLEMQNICTRYKIPRMTPTSIDASPKHMHQHQALLWPTGTTSSGSWNSEDWWSVSYPPSQNRGNVKLKETLSMIIHNKNTENQKKSSLYSAIPRNDSVVAPGPSRVPLSWDTRPLGEFLTSSDFQHPICHPYLQSNQ